jgi:excinuclease UvrABC helicase subunit UvrB
MNGGDGGCCTGAHALPPQGGAAAAAATNSSSNLVMSGTATSKKWETAIDEAREKSKKQRHHNQHLGKKRKYEEDESDVEKGCRENEKMFKCNYWEDPAYSKKLQRDGLQRARIAAHDNQTERLLMLLQSGEPDRYRRFDDPDYYW